jgi:ATP-binding cassette, subfamily B, bacterial
LIVVVVVMLFRTDPVLAVCALAPLPFVNLTARRFSGAIHPAVRRVQQEQAQLATVVEETVAGIRVVKGFGAERVQSTKLPARPTTSTSRRWERPGSARPTCRSWSCSRPSG